MYKNYFKIAYRNLLKNKVFSAVNILGLAIGMAACFFIFQYVHFEWSYDRFTYNYRNVYRVPISYSGSFANIGTSATNHPAVGPAMKADFPEVIDFARLAPSSLFMRSPTITYKNGSKTMAFNEEKIYFADPSVFKLFPFPIFKGNPRDALSESNTIVISRTISEKYFGNESAMNKILYLNGKKPLKVTGVFNDVPENSHIKFEILIPFSTISENFGYDEWKWPEFYTYVLLAPGTDPKKIDARFPAFVKKYLGTVMKELAFGNEYHLQPVTDIHLRSHYLNEFEANGSEKEIYFLSVIGVFILIIAWINFINLSTAKSIERAKEVGLRKVIGASKLQLVGQFIMESVVINMLALVIATILVMICFPYFGQFIGKRISSGFLSSTILHEPLFWFSLFIIFVAGAFIVGAYPAFILSSFKPALVFKGKNYQFNKGILLRRILVSFQFVLSILLIAGTITVYRQLSFMRDQPLGFNKDQVLILKAPSIQDSTFANKMNTFKRELLNNQTIINATSSSDIPGKSILDRNSVRRANDNKTHNFTTFFMLIDEYFINTYNMDLAAGRNFLHGESFKFNDTKNLKVVLNEEVVKALGYKSNEEAIHQDIIVKIPDDVKAKVIGVVKNYHQKSLRDPYDPILYIYPEWNNWKYFSLHINVNNINREISSIESVYKKFFLGNPFEYFFLDESFNQQYLADQRFGKVIGLFTLIAILVSCLGLLGLSSLVIKLRTKEIGIRKVLGATVYSILALLSKEFIKLVCITSAIAIPIIFLAANRWLNNYAFHIHLSWIIFILPPILLLVISLSTIGIQSLIAALANPIKSLRTE